MKPAGRERNMAANIDALRQNASRAGVRVMGRAAPTCICRVTGVRNGPRCNADAAPDARTLRQQWLAKG
jgi:hypothetical protein